MSLYNMNQPCISCRTPDLQLIYNFGETPISDQLTIGENLSRRHHKEELALLFCSNCALVQLSKHMPKEDLYGDDYPYLSSISDELLNHTRQNALDLIERFDLEKGSFVIEIASNDGYMLKNFKPYGINVLGIDPALIPVQKALERDIPTIKDFFTSKVAFHIVDSHQKADIIIANNILAHVSDLSDFIEGMNIILKTEGSIIIEVPYLIDLIDSFEFDTIYHQHLCYFSVTSLHILFKRHGLFVNSIKRLPIHGGSLRLYVSRNQSSDSTVQDLLDLENQRQVRIYPFFDNFINRLNNYHDEIHQLLSSIVDEGKIIVGYGAAAKANTFLSFCKIDHNILLYIADKNTVKQGKFMTGTQIPIVSPEKILSEIPDYVLILAWNFKEEIMYQLKEYKKSGGQFIIPLPSPHIIS